MDRVVVAWKKQIISSCMVQIGTFEEVHENFIEKDSRMTPNPRKLSFPLYYLCIKSEVYTNLCAIYEAGRCMYS